MRDCWSARPPVSFTLSLPPAFPSLSLPMCVCQLDRGPHPRLRQPLCCMHRSVAASILQDRTQTETDGGLDVASAISSVRGKCKSIVDRDHGISILEC
ncbi:hypothetical protein CMEL01_03533 [Colletotrichum melonis]|nr:uncharacterized protein CCOS01_06342 [Colletotrichum costaricense]XP_060376809.1 uncharacterized protein CTAM01_12529 [Colletotrichum tamarilloi]KAK1454773.1 hypothetical protein CMEL01_03533 [Colletotrichum melonis]KAK1485461.1 hypothetical protein CTAM01_12529 [Colletotrichum tamarilloi]KAK1528508.1 hypothetical protein CCOS01_06342 [Colletotrichum costaricense]